MVFFQSYPERFYFEGLLESAGALASAPTVQYLPIYFGNVCLRFLPVSALDLLPLSNTFSCQAWLGHVKDKFSTCNCNSKCVMGIYFLIYSFVNQSNLNALDAKCG